MQFFKASEMLKAARLGLATPTTCGCCSDRMIEEDRPHADEYPEGMTYALAVRYGDVCAPCADMHTPCACCATPVKAGDEWSATDDGQPLCSFHCEDNHASASSDYGYGGAA